MTIDIGGRGVGDERACLIIAEVGVNHNGSVEMARRLIDAAVDAGADAVKFQSFDAATLVTAGAPKAPYQIANTGNAGSQLEMLQALQLDAAAFADLHRHSRERGILFLSTPFDEANANMLAALDVPAFKVSSGELTNTPLLRHLAGFGRPVILSTGMAGLSDVEAAVRAVEGGGARELVLLHCVSSYPAAPADVNLRAMATLRSAFGFPVGYSDHTDGSAIGIAAVALGAAVLEKHLTLDRTLPGPDHRASLDPIAFRELVRAVRDVECALGDGRKRPTPAERQVADASRRSVVAARSIEEGEKLTAAVLTLRRPGTGILPSALPHVVGRRARRAIMAGTVITWDMLR